jgi:hypothetical protein
MAVTPPVLCILAFGSLWSQTPQSPRQEKATGETIATLAGKYFQGDGFVGETTFVSLPGRYGYHWFANDGGSVREKGTAAMVDDYLIPPPTKSKTNRRRDALHDRRYRPTRCGKRVVP